MAFEKKVPTWNAPGIEPPESLKESGFTAGYKPPAEYFNWYMHGMAEAAKELQERVDDSAPAPFVVTLSGNEDDGYEIDYTFDAIVGAYNQGRVIRLIEFVPGPAIMEYKLEVAVSDQVVFANSERMYHKTVNIYRNGRITRVNQTLFSDKYPPHYTDIGAEPVGAVSDHDKNKDAHKGMFAPAGFGLGWAQSLTTYNEGNLDTCTAPGWYFWDSKSASTDIAGYKGQYWYLHVIAYGDGHLHCRQEIYPATRNFYSPIVRKCSSGTWGDWEWENPPMSSNAEYRTTRRVNERPVFVKRVIYYLGAAINALDEPDGVMLSIPHEVEGIGWLIECNCVMDDQELVPTHGITGNGIILVEEVDQSSINVYIKGFSVAVNTKFAIEISYTKA